MEDDSFKKKINKLRQTTHLGKKYYFIILFWLKNKKNNFLILFIKILLNLSIFREKLDLKRFRHLINIDILTSLFYLLPFDPLQECLLLAFEKWRRMIFGRIKRRLNPRNIDSNNKKYLKTKISIPIRFNKMKNIINYTYRRFS